MKNIFTLIGLFISSFAFSATVKGIVKDAVTNEPLMGATVVLKETKFGSAVSLDGSYQINNVPVGSYESINMFLK